MAMNADGLTFTMICMMGIVTSMEVAQYFCRIVLATKIALVFYVKILIDVNHVTQKTDHIASLAWVTDM
jgi:hypothetical protein